MLSRLTVIDVSSRPMLALGGGISRLESLEGIGLPVLFGISVVGGTAFGTIGVGRFCSAMSAVALSGRLMIFGTTGPPGAAGGEADSGADGGGAFAAGAAGA